MKQTKMRFRTNWPNVSKPGRVILFLFFLSIILISGKELTREGIAIHRSEKTYHSLQTEKKTAGVGGLKKRYDNLLFWISIKGTPFDYPVLQDKTQPNRYLHQDILGRDSFYGTPFLDARCDKNSDNLLVYGHNINGHRLFGYLQNYRGAAFYQAHPEITVSTEEGTATYTVISVLETDIHDPAYSLIQWTRKDSEIQRLADRSLYACRLPAKPEKIRQLLTLSTCRSGEGRDKRLLVIAAR